MNACSNNNVKIDKMGNESLCVIYRHIVEKKCIMYVSVSTPR